MNFKLFYFASLFDETAARDLKFEKNMRTYTVLQVCNIYFTADLCVCLSACVLCVCTGFSASDMISSCKAVLLGVSVHSG
jgi:hypothetical protein